MNRTMAIPHVLHAFNIYNRGHALVGISGDVKLPDFEAMVETLSGPGIAGEVEEPIVGFFGSMEIEIPWAILYGDYFDSLAFASNQELMLRGSEQIDNKSNGQTEEASIRVVIRGKTKKAELGNASQGKKNENKSTTEVVYIKIEVDGKTKVELDKLNFVFNVNGKDLMANVRKNI